jgi:hypothetical protein
MKCKNCQAEIGENEYCSETCRLMYNFEKRKQYKLDKEYGKYEDISTTKNRKART